MKNAKRLHRLNLFIAYAAIVGTCLHPISTLAQLSSTGIETSVNTTVLGSQQRPAAATGQSGATVITWESASGDGDGQGIFAQVYDEASAVTITEFQVNTTTSADQRFPDVAVADNGQFAITWMSDGQDGDGWGIYYALFDGSGNSILGESIVNTTTAGQQRFPSIAMDPDGAFVIAWESAGEIVARRFGNSGVPQGAEFQVNTTTNGLQSYPDVATSNQGNFCVTWQGIDANVGRSDIFGQLYAADGSASGGQFLINSTQNQNQIEPTVAIAPDGSFAVAWSSFLQDGDGYGIYLQQYNASGAAQGPETKVSETSAADQLHADMEATAGGAYVLSWTSFNQDGARGGIYARVLNSSGAFESPETLVNTTTAENQIFPAIGVYRNVGPLTVVWQDGDRTSTTSSDGDGYGILLQRFNIEGIEAIAKDISVVLDLNGQATILASDLDDGSTAGTTLSINMSSFDCSNLGVNFVTLTATAPDGRTATTTSMVTILDDLPPSLTVSPTFDLVLDEQGQATLQTADVVTNSSDNCAVSSLTLSRSDFGCEDVGLQQVTVKATDPSGLESSASVDVTVVDSTDPSIVTADITLYLNPDGEGSLTAADIDGGTSDACGFTLEIDKTDFNCNDTGPNTVTLTAQDPSGNSASMQATVTVLDTITPVALAQNVTIFLDAAGFASTSVLDVDAGTSDACGVGLVLNDSLFSCSDLGANEVSLTATDVNGNVSSTNATVTVLDTFPPLLTVPAAYDLILNDQGEALLTAAEVITEVSDNCSVASTTLSKSQFDCSDLGPQSVTVSATDVSGNVTERTVAVSVLDTQSPVVLVQNLTLLLDRSGRGTITTGDFDGGTTDNCNFSLGLDIDTFDCSNLGSNTVTLTATDDAGNEAFVSGVVTVVDTVSPAPAAQNLIVQLGASGNASITAEQVDNGSSDNCSIASLAIDKTDFTCADVGPNTVTLTVTDPSGNTSSTTATVTVEDNIPPIAIAQDITIALDENGLASITAEEVDNGSSDNCGIASLSIDQTSFDCATVGENTVTLTVTDTNGNTATATATITVVDDIPPTLECQDVTVALDENGFVSGNPFINGALVSRSDNCQVQGGVGASGPNRYDCSFLGQNPVTIFQRDVNGNQVTCNYVLTIIDDMAPVAIAQDITVQLGASGNASITAEQVDNGSSDNCSIASLAIDKTDFTCADVGPNTVTLTVTDPSGNTSSTTATVTVEDNIPPIAIAQDITIALDENGLASITAEEVDNGSSDNCGIASLSIDQTSFDCATVGENTVTLTVTDTNGNTATATATITVVDDIPPTLECQDVTVALDENGFVSGNPFINGALVSRSDNCQVQGGVGASGPNRYDCSFLGQNPVTIFQRDVNGNQVTCNYVLTIIDDMAPVAIAQDITVQLDASGNASITAEQVDNGSSDNCSVNLSIDKTDFTCADVGPNTVTLAVTDPSGNTSSTTATVTVEDNTPPTAIAQDLTVALDENGLASITAEEVDNGSFDNCGIASLSIDQTNFDCSTVGENTITLTVTDTNGNTATATATITVIDDIPPTLECQDVTLTLNANGEAPFNVFAAGAIVSRGDNCGVVGSVGVTGPTLYTCGSLGENSITVFQSDVNGNRVTCNFILTIVDNMAPIAVAQNLTIQLDGNGNASITAEQVDNGSSDNCSIASLAIDKTDFTCADVGPNTVTLTVTDPSGNTSSTTATVTVEDNTPPTAITQDLTVALDENGLASITAEEVNNGSSDNCGIASLSIDRTSFDCATVGENTVTLTVTDTNGNTATATATITVVDDIPPTLECQDVTLTLNANGEAPFNVFAAGAIVSRGDNCGVVGSVGVTGPTLYTCSSLGENSITVFQSDVNGNRVTCNFTLTIVDNIAPTAVAQNLTIQLDGSGNASITAEQVDNGSSDNCSIASLAIDKTDFTCADVGPNTVTLTVTDPSGNTSSTTATVTVEDNIPPIAIAQDLTIALDENGLASVTAQEVNNGSSDNCGIASLSIDQTSFDCATVGENTVTLTVTDTNGNTASTTATITVIDDIPPTLECQDVTLTLNANGEAPFNVFAAGAFVSRGDNCGVVGSVGVTGPTLYTCSSLGENSITVFQNDVNGNRVTCNFTLTIVDNMAPTAVVQNLTIQLDGSGNASITAEQVDNGSSDNCSIASLSIDKSNFTCADVGPNTVTLTVTDPSGNTSSTTATVTVEDNTPPTAIAQDLTIALDENGLASVTAQEVNNGSSDNCGIASLSIDQTNFDCATVGENTVTLTVTDTNGNTATATATITVIDDIPPTLECQDVTLALDENGFVSGNPFINGALVSRSDNCQVQGGVNVTGPRNYDCGFLGDNAVTIFQRDVNGNQVTCNYVLTIIDDMAPVAIAQNITVQLDASGNASITAEQVDNGSSDNCSVNLSIDKTDFTCADVGPNTVTLTVTDPSGNTSSTTATVTVEDNIPPIAIAQDLTIALDENGLASITAEEVDNGSSDTCGIASLSIDRTSFDCAAVGENTVTLTVTDTNGNTATATATITVVDDIPPTLECQDVTLALDENGFVSGNPFINGALVSRSDNCQVQGGVNVTGPRNYDCGFLGDNPVTIFQRDVNGNQVTCNYVLTIIDDMAPVAIAQDITVQLDASGNASITAEQVDNGSSDNCSVNLSIDKTDFTCADVGPNTVRLTVIDPSGNTSSTTATVTIEDDLPPEIFCEDVIVELDENGRGSYPLADVFFNSSDNCDITFVGINGGFYDCDDLGEQTVTIFVDDPSGNRSTCQPNVTVVDLIAPFVQTQDITVALDANGVATISTEDIDAGTTDNCSLATLSIDRSDFTCEDVGSNIVTLTATDISGNSSSMEAVVTVIDPISPVVLTQDITIALDESGNATITPAQIDNGSFDNCSVDLTLDISAFNCTDIGTKVVTLTAADQQGNISSGTATVTVEDATPPILVTKPLSILLDENGRANITELDIDDGSSDNCSASLHFSLSQTEFDCDDLGVNPITVRVFDDSGNESSEEVLITVEDTIPPTVQTQNIVVPLDLTTGRISITPEDIDDGSFDNCTIVDRRLDNSDFDCLAIGEQTVTLTVRDQSGNEASAPALVTIIAEDEITPSAVCRDITVALDENGQATIAASDLDGGSSDICGIASLTLSQSTFSCEDLGSNQVELTIVNLLGNESTCIANVTVVDQLAPTLINIPQETIVYEARNGCTVNVDFQELGITTEDNCGTAKVTFAPSSGAFAVSDVPYEVTVTTIDESGNATEALFEILVTKRQPFVSIQTLTASSLFARITGSYDSREITSLSIDWGDGSDQEPLSTIGSLFSGTHEYPQGGEYLVTLHLTNSCGANNQIIRRLVVRGNRWPSRDQNETVRGSEQGRETVFGKMELTTYPNPFARELNVRFKPQVSDFIEVVIYNLQGKEIHRMFAGEVTPSTVYDWSFESTELLSSGVYLIKIKGRETDLTRRVIYERRLRGPNGH